MSILLGAGQLRRRSALHCRSFPPRRRRCSRCASEGRRVSLGSSTISWSQPTPVRRSEMARASAGVTSNGCSRASTITKSLPRPCILWKGRRIGRGLRERHGPSPPAASRDRMQRAANEVMQSIIFSAMLDARRRAEARLGRASQPAAARRSGDPSERDVRRPAQGTAGRRSPRARARRSRSFSRKAMRSARASRCSSRGRWTACPERQRHAPGSPDRRAGHRAVLAGEVRRSGAGQWTGRGGPGAPSRPRKPKGKPKF